MNATIPDPRQFAMAALEAEGALVERGDSLALLPQPLAAALGMPEELQLGSPAAPCGFGSPLLEALVGRARAGVPSGAARLDEPAPRPSVARAQAERYVIRNGVFDVIEVGERVERWLALAVAWTTEADERREGLALVVVHGNDGGIPDARWIARLDPHTLENASARGPAPEQAASFAARRAPLEVEPAVTPILAATRRRHEREHVRLNAWYTSLITEAKRPRRRADPGAVNAKIAHIQAEREAKLAELAHRYRVTVRLAPAACLWVEAPAATVRLRARRRKGTRELDLRLPAGAAGFDALPCEGCAGWVTRPALCDDRLHVLCERCVPTAEGRARCPACKEN